MIQRDNEHRWLGMVALVASIAGATPAWGQLERPVVAVFSLQNKGAPIEAPVVDRLSDYISTELVRSGRYLAVPNSDLKSVLARQVRESYKECYDPSCQIEVGKELAASQVLSGTILKIGRRCIVTVKLFDLRQSTKVAAGRGRGNCSVDGVLDSVDAAMTALVGARSGASQRPTGVVAAYNVPTPDYGDPDAEIRAATESPEVTARRALEWKKHERRVAAANDWRKVQRWVQSDALPMERRISILKKHIDAFGPKNPNLDRAKALLARLEPVDGMVFVPAGGFVIGCDPGEDPDCDDDDSPRRQTSLFAFRIDKTEVSVAAYLACVESGKCDRITYRTKREAQHCNLGQPGRTNHPMNCVDWDDAVAYCRSLNKRLPTEEEWEKAARGTDGRKYPWGQEPAASCTHAVVDDRPGTPSAQSKTKGCGRDSTWSVDSKPAGASPYGAVNMAGNVSEWTSSRPPYGRSRIIRGGAWVDGPAAHHAARRQRKIPSYRSITLGFRCASSM